MSNKLMSIPRINDQIALHLFRSMHSKHAATSFYLDIAGLDGIDLLTKLDAEKTRTIERLDVPGSYLIFSLSLGYPGFSITYTRGGDPNRKNTLVDDLAVNMNGQQDAFPSDKRLDLLGIINRFLAERDMVANDSGEGDDSVTALDMTYRSTILKLENKFAEQIAKITSWTVDQADAYEKRKLELAEETKIERALLFSDYEAKESALKGRANELDDLRKKLDDRDYMHARRAIRGELQEIVKAREEKFTLTSNTRNLRLPVHLAMILLLFFLIALNGVLFEQLSKLDLAAIPMTVLAWLLVKQGLAAAAFVGSIFYYIRWMNRWFEQHSAAEFLLKQFQLDIDRASWVVETALEWRRDQKTEIPTPLLEGITRNLFSERDAGPDRGTAADDLASALVGNASQVKLKLGGNEVSLDRKGLVGLSRTETAAPGHH
jgi:hypothetical protein